MKINKYIGAAAISFGLMLCATGCSDFTEIDPKGMNLLETTSQLDMLLNYQYSLDTDYMMEISGDIIYCYSNLNTLMNQPVKTASQILITWDEDGHDKELPELTASDDWYSDCYEIIGKVANPILAKIESATGPEDDRIRIKAEAHVLRAYFHYLAVQKFAKAYNPATADSEDAIVYVTEDMDIKTPAEPLKLKDFYGKIIADLDAAIATGGLPKNNINRMRMSLPCAYAVKALALMSMQDFNGAATAAREALGINSTVVDYNTMTKKTTGYIIGGEYDVLLRPKQECAEDYFNVDNIQFYTAITPYGEEMFEKGHAVHDKFSTDRVMYDFMMGMGKSMLGEEYDWTFTYDLESSWNNIGLKTTQMYLILAETAIAAGQYDEAMKNLDIIREKRISPELYAPLAGTVSDKATAIEHLRQTAHGENIWTVFNFIDRKRWTQLDDYKQTLTRTFGTRTMTLTPESSLWVFPIPKNVLSMNPYIHHNF